MSEKNQKRSYQDELRKRVNDSFPFEDDSLVSRAAKDILMNVSSAANIRLRYPHRFTKGEQNSVFNHLRRSHSGLIERTLFLDADIDHEGVKVPGTVILVERKSRR